MTVEPPIDTAWRKSSYSAGTQGDCVEVGSMTGGRVAMRDSKNPRGGALVFERAAMDVFLRG